MFNNLREDIRSIKERDPAARSGFEVFMLYSGLHAVMYYRMSHWFYMHRHYYIARRISQHAKFKTGVEIHPGATIGKGLFIDHGMGVVIGETTEIGDYCTLYQGVTLGGTGKDKGKRHPTLGDNVKVGANALVLMNVPANATAVGVPARVVRLNGRKVQRGGDLDQIHIPDPVSQEICKIDVEIDALSKRLNTLSREENKQ